jgi:hypothetical protein
LRRRKKKRLKSAYAIAGDAIKGIAIAGDMIEGVAIAGDLIEGVAIAGETAQRQTRKPNHHHEGEGYLKAAGGES